MESEQISVLHSCITSIKIHQTAVPPHRTGTNKKVGGSNYTFVDGSVRLLKYGESVSPVNLWAVTDEWRDAPEVPLDVLK